MTLRATMTLTTMLGAALAAACTSDGDPVETGDVDTSGGSGSATVSASDTASATATASDSASASQSASNSASDTATDPSTDPTDPSDTGDSSSDGGADTGSSDGGPSTSGNASEGSTGGESGSSSTGEACVPIGESGCAPGQAECCEGSQCMPQGDVLTCVPCGLEGDPCQPNGGGNAGCCGQLGCVQGLGGFSCG